MWAAKLNWGRDAGPMRQIRQKDSTNQAWGQEGGACGLHSQGGLQSHDGGWCVWAVGAGVPKTK